MLFKFNYVGQKALKDAGVTFEKIEQAFVGYVYGKMIWINLLINC